MNANRKRFLICLSLVTFSVGCSDVEFEDYIPEQPTSLSQPPELETPAIIPPVFKSEEFVQGAMTRPIDILFVVDNSPSMVQEQEEMGKRIESFLSVLENVDWKVGFTTTDVSSGNFGLKGDLLKIEGTNKYFLEKNDSDYKEKFLKTIQRKESDCFIDCPSSDEQPLLAAILAMSKHNSSNAGFFRSHADIAIVILSDEDEMSSGPSAATKPIDVIKTVQSIWPGQKRMKAYGIAIEPGDFNCLRENSNGNYGNLIANLVQVTGGVLGSICSKNYGESLKKIGESVLHLTQVIELNEAPDPDQIKIAFVPDTQDVHWEVRGKEIHFANPPKIGTKIIVSYAAK
ncbi:MAG: hypothetical protein KDD61_16665 [Bdellovibrionales bacterium]|nr:hypothetical protein [Bdellovibrionales bacterium]